MNHRVIEARRQRCADRSRGCAIAARVDPGRDTPVAPVDDPGRSVRRGGPRVGAAGRVAAGAIVRLRWLAVGLRRPVIAAGGSVLRRLAVRSPVYVLRVEAPVLDSPDSRASNEGASERTSQHHGRSSSRSARMRRRPIGAPILVGPPVARRAIERRLALDSAEAKVRAARARLSAARIAVLAFAAVHAELRAHAPARARATCRDGLARRRRRRAVLVAAANLAGLAVASLLTPERHGEGAGTPGRLGGAAPRSLDDAARDAGRVEAAIVRAQIARRGPAERTHIRGAAIGPAGAAGRSPLPTKGSPTTTAAAGRRATRGRCAARGGRFRKKTRCPTRRRCPTTMCCPTRIRSPRRSRRTKIRFRTTRYPKSRYRRTRPPRTTRSPRRRSHRTTTTTPGAGGRAFPAAGRVDRCIDRRRDPRRQYLPPRGDVAQTSPEGQSASLLQSWKSPAGHDVSQVDVAPPPPKRPPMPPRLKQQTSPHPGLARGRGARQRRAAALARTWCTSRWSHRRRSRSARSRPASSRRTSTHRTRWRRCSSPSCSRTTCRRCPIPRCFRTMQRRCSNPTPPRSSWRRTTRTRPRSLRNRTHLRSRSARGARAGGAARARARSGGAAARRRVVGRIGRAYARDQRVVFERTARAAPGRRDEGTRHEGGEDQERYFRMHTRHRRCSNCSASRPGRGVTTARFSEKGTPLRCSLVPHMVTSGLTSGSLAGSAGAHPLKRARASAVLV